MATVLAIEASRDLATKYTRAFRRRFVYSHPAFSPNPGEHRLIECFDSDATKDRVDTTLKDNEVDFITGSGHGTVDTFTGHNGSVIWDTNIFAPQNVRGAIVHLLSCAAGAQLGPLFVQKGARAFWGYSAQFKVTRDLQHRGSIESDPIAEHFYKVDSMVDIGILEGLDAPAIYDKVRESMTHSYFALIAQVEYPLAPAMLLGDFAHLVGPFMSYGDPHAHL